MQAQTCQFAYLHNTLYAVEKGRQKMLLAKET